MQKQLIYPMAAIILHIFISAIFMLKRRVRSVVNREVHPKYYKAFISDRPVSEELIVLNNHFNNQFQVPILFLFTLTIALLFQLTDTISIVLAWSFVLSRLMHSAIFLSYNNPLHRLLAYSTGWFIVMLLWIKILIY